MKLVFRAYSHHLEAAARIDLIWERNRKIRCAFETIPPVPYRSHQQAIRVIQEERDRIELAPADIRPL